MTKVCVNAYSITGTDELSWRVRQYSVRSLDGRTLTQEHRGRMKNAAFALRRAHASQCRGYGFVIDVDAQTIVLPATWQIPAGAEHEGLAFESVLEVTANASNPTHDLIVGGIMREAMKRHIKDTNSPKLGPLWQDFGRFCQMPDWRANNRVAHCRAFDVLAKRAAAQRWILTISVSTTAVDAHSIADYLRHGQGRELADLIQSKRESHTTRDGSPAAIRAFCHGEGLAEGRIVELDEPDVLCATGSLAAQEQRTHATVSLRCHSFARDTELIPPGALFLVLDTQQTEELHAETILEPSERFQFAADVREHLLDADLYGPMLGLSAEPVDCSSNMLSIAPPDLLIKGPHGTEILKCRVPVTDQSIQQRSRARKERVVKNGFLVSRPMRPLLAVPEQLGQARADRLLLESNEILRNHGVDTVTFTKRTYRDAGELRRAAEEGGYDAVLAVLPDARRHADETYERIKRTLEVPSQCLQGRNVVPQTWAERPPQELASKDARLARKLRNGLELTVVNLLVKHNWVPYAPATPYHFNVHVGVDVGGVHSTNAAACVGYGFAAADTDLVFKLSEIPVAGAKKEPIERRALRSGLLEILDGIAEAVEKVGQSFDATRLLLYRDGPLLGRGNAWNEIDALHELLEDARQRGWINGEPHWAALEITKDAEGLRVFELLPQPSNPLVGTCVFPFCDPLTALVSSTGRPYLPQGTAAPLKVHMIRVAGSPRFEDALQDLVWQCDLGFTKPDMGSSLPWVLRVADASALQLSRSHKISGIAA